jgi:hypothetical protein
MTGLRMRYLSRTETGDTTCLTVYGILASFVVHVV